LRFCFAQIGIEDVTPLGRGLSLPQGKNGRAHLSGSRERQIPTPSGRPLHGCHTWLSALQLGLDRRHRSALRDVATFCVQSLDPSRQRGTLGHGLARAAVVSAMLRAAKPTVAISATAIVMVHKAQATAAATAGGRSRMCGLWWVG
jgi:hypothetical protein